MNRDRHVRIICCFIISFILFLSFAGARLVKDVIFDINCAGRLKRAADANTIELAAQELDVAIKYLEENNMTNGSTAVLWKAPKADIGFFYKNLKSSLDELNKVDSKTTQLERTNILMKLRETLIDHNGAGDHVTMPDGISLFPHNLSWFWFGFCMFSLLLVNIFLMIVMFIEI